MHYTLVTLEEMKSFLGPKFTHNSPIDTKEYVFEYHLAAHPQIVVKVYSSIHLNTAVARKKGADAIRICAVHTGRNIGWIRSTRVLRVEGWKHNLAKAIHKVIDQANARFSPITEGFIIKMGREV